MSSWRVGSYMQRENLNQSCHVHFKSCSLQGIRKWISYELTFRDGSVLRVKIVLDDNSRSLVYETAVDFRLRGSAGKSIPRLDFTLPIGYRTERCRCGVPFGMLDRVAADHDIPCLSYTAALPAEAGKSMLALMSDCKYGYRFWDNTLSLGLIRGSYEPDPTPEIEPTSFRLAISVLPTENEMTPDCSGSSDRCQRTDASSSCRFQWEYAHLVCPGKVGADVDDCLLRTLSIQKLHLFFARRCFCFAAELSLYTNKLLLICE